MAVRKRIISRLEISKKLIELNKEILDLEDIVTEVIDEFEVLLGVDYPFPYGKYIYGGFAHELLSKDNGQTIYLLVSQWTEELYGVELYEVKFK